MKRIVALALTVGAGLAVAACQDLCGHAQSTMQKLNSFSASCSDGGSSSSCFDQSACEKALPNCSSADQQVMTNELNCLDKALSNNSGCTSGAFDMLGCLEQDGGTISAACQGAFANSPSACGADAG